MRACMSASKPKIEAKGAKAAMTQPPGTPGGRHHADGQDKDEMEEERQTARHAVDKTDGKGATGYLHHRARHVDGGA